MGTGRQGLDGGVAVFKVERLISSGCKSPKCYVPSSHRDGSISGTRLGKDSRPFDLFSHPGICLSQEHTLGPSHY